MMACMVRPAQMLHVIIKRLDIGFDYQFGVVFASFQQRGLDVFVEGLACQSGWELGSSFVKLLLQGQSCGIDRAGEVAESNGLRKGQRISGAAWTDFDVFGCDQFVQNNPFILRKTR